MLHSSRKIGKPNNCVQGGTLQERGSSFVFVLTTTSFTCGGEKAEALIRKNKTSSGIMGKRRQPQTEPEEAEYGREQFITYKVKMSISHSDHTEISQKSDI